MCRLLCLALLLTSCVKGPKGDPGPTGAATPAAKRLVWVDATGAEVGPAEVSTDYGSYFDAQGLLWPVEPDTARAVAPDDNGRSPLFETGDCTGTAYVGLVAPRQVFKMKGETALRVRPDAQASKTLSAVFSLSSGSCASVGTSARPVIELAPTAPGTALQVPTLAFAPPLHKEWR